MAVPTYEELYEAAAAKTGVPASTLAGLTSVESGGNPGETSPTGAKGLTQFEPGTAKTYGVNTSPGGERSQIFGAANYLKALGYAKNPRLALSSYNAGPGNPGAAGPYAADVLAAAKAYMGYNKPEAGGAGVAGTPGTRSVALKFPNASAPNNNNLFNTLAGLEAGRQQVIAADPTVAAAPDALQQGWDSLASLMGPTTVNPGTVNINQKVPNGVRDKISGGIGKGDANPLPGWNIGRTDMGVDASARVGMPVRAPNNSIVEHIFPNWYAGQPYVLLKLVSGPNKGKYYYVAEQIDHLPQVGQYIPHNQVVARFAPTGTGIEIGWGTPSWQTLAQSQGNTGDAAHGNAPAGVNFAKTFGL